MLAFRVVLPLVLMMATGYIVRRLNITDDHSLNTMNKLVFRVFLPLLLFLNIYSLEPGEAFCAENMQLIGIVFLCILLTVLLMHLIFPFFIQNKRQCSVMIQGIFRSNLILFGIPIAASIYGENRIGKVSLLAAATVPFFNFLAVIVLEYYRGSKANPKKIMIGILKNPLIISSILAFLFLLLNIKIPDLILAPLNSMSKVATPLAFIVLGGTFRFHELIDNKNFLTAAVIGKLFLFPFIIFTTAVIMGFHGESLVALIGTTASPTAVSSFTMAASMEADDKLAGQIVMITSIFSVLSIFFWVLLLKTLQLI